MPNGLKIILDIMPGMLAEVLNMIIDTATLVSVCMMESFVGMQGYHFIFMTAATETASL